MRRALAFLLSAVFGFSAVVPALLADNSSNLPACCRRFGQHHCSLLLDDSGSPSLKGVCASYTQKAAAAVSPERTVVLGASRSTIALVSRHAVPDAQPLSQLRNSLDRAYPKRGPPTLL